MKKYIALLLVIIVGFFIYTSMNNNPISENEKTNNTIITGSVESTSTSSPSSITDFKASGGEPFWAADFSGSTLSRNAVDYSSVVITGFIGPTTSGATSVRSHT
jgi:uncharacterized membrane protein